MLFLAASSLPAYAHGSKLRDAIINFEEVSLLAAMSATAQNDSLLKRSLGFDRISAEAGQLPIPRALPS
jgi:hypothetical protein